MSVMSCTGYTTRLAWERATAARSFNPSLSRSACTLSQGPSVVSLLLGVHYHTPSVGVDVVGGTLSSTSHFIPRKVGVVVVVGGTLSSTSHFITVGGEKSSAGGGVGGTISGFIIIKKSSSSRLRAFSPCPLNFFSHPCSFFPTGS